MKPTSQVDLSYVHLVGIGGIGMSALALYALQSGMHVTGSDLVESPIISLLRSRGASITIGHFEENCLSKGTLPQVVVYGSAIPPENPEIQWAIRTGTLLMHRATFLNKILEGHKHVLVLGSHGKTTTTALIIHMLSSLDPSYILGGQLQNNPLHGNRGAGTYFIAEADESDGTFTQHKPQTLVITNLDKEHLNYWEDVKHLKKEVHRWSLQSAFLVWCADDPHLLEMHLPGVSYGFSRDALVRVYDYQQKGLTSVFSLHCEGRLYPQLLLNLAGEHNALNAAAAVTIGLHLGLSEPLIRERLASFPGTRRRADYKGVVYGRFIYDDYAHHPVEIHAALQTCRKAHPGHPIIAVFQPHRYTRTKECFASFIDALQIADQVILTEIYGAGEPVIEGLEARFLLEMQKKGMLVDLCPSHLLKGYLHHNTNQGDVLIFLGAGSITQMCEQFVKS